MPFQSTRRPLSWSWRLKIKGFWIRRNPNLALSSYTLILQISFHRLIAIFVMIRWTSFQILGQKLHLNACVVSYRNIPTTRHLLKFVKGYDCFIWAYTWRVWNAEVNSMGRCRDAGKDWSRRQLQVLTKLFPRNWSPRIMDMDSIHVGSRKKQFFLEMLCSPLSFMPLNPNFLFLCLGLPRQLLGKWPYYLR